jgi:uncharacterized LabA/DUF88 family protein
MDRAAVFIDAGYLFAAGARLLTTGRPSRDELYLDYDALLTRFTELTRELTGLPLLRIYWYDASFGGPTPQQIALAYRPNLKLRLGSLNQQGQQKGVDSLLILDLVTLARNRAMADALLVTGDEDIRVGVQQAQELGVRVHLIGVSPARENQSGTLVQDADTLRELSAAELQSFLSLGSPPGVQGNWAAASGNSGSAGPDLSAVARRIAQDLSREELEVTRQESLSGSLPPQVDRRLLLAGSNEVGGAALSSEQKRELRAAFIDLLRER